MEPTKLTWGVRKIIDHVSSLAIAFSAFRHFIAAQGHDVRAKLGMFLPFVERHMPPAIPHLEEHYNKAHELDAFLHAAVVAGEMLHANAKAIQLINVRVGLDLKTHARNEVVYQSGVHYETLSKLEPAAVDGVHEDLQRRHRDAVCAYQRNRSAPQGFRRLFNTVKDIMRYKEALSTLNMHNLLAALNQNKVYEGSGRLNASRYARDSITGCSTSSASSHHFIDSCCLTPFLLTLRAFLISVT